MIMLAEIASAGISFDPLRQVAQDLITGIAAIAAALVPVAIAYAIAWGRSKLKINKQAALDATTTSLADMIERVRLYDADVLLPLVRSHLDKVEFPVDKDTAVRANYVISQVPDQLKAAGMDPTTQKGQEAIVRWVAAAMTLPAAVQPNARIEVTTPKSATPGG